MLEIHKIGNTQYIKSPEFYLSIGCSLKSHSRWMKLNVVDHGIQGFDYLPAERDHLLPLNFGRKSDTFYLTVDFCKGLCLVAKTNASKRVRVWLHSI